MTDEKPPTRGRKPLTPTQQMQRALKAKGYQQLFYYPVSYPQGSLAASFGKAFIVYTNGQTMLCLQVYTDDGCFLYGELAPEHTLEAAIAAIPPKKD